MDHEESQEVIDGDTNRGAMTYVSLAVFIISSRVPVD